MATVMPERRWWREMLEAALVGLLVAYVAAFLLLVYLLDLQTEVAILGLIVPTVLTVWVEQKNQKALKRQDAVLADILRRLPEPATSDDPDSQ